MIFLHILLSLFCTMLQAETISERFEQNFKEVVEKRIKDGKDVPEQVMLRYQNKTIDWHIGSLDELTVPNFSKIEDRVHEKCSSKCCGVAIPISQADIGPDGFVISESGIYCLKEDIEFDPSADNLAAITINADFVILDFSEHVLTQSVGSYLAFSNIKAVVINPGSNYVTVRNGTILQFSNLGIFSKGLNMSSLDHKGLLIEKMRVLNCGKIATLAQDRIVFPSVSAIAIDSSHDVIITECVTAVTQGLFADGIDTQFSDNVIIKDSIAVDHVGQFLGIGIVSFIGRDILIKDCQAERNNSLDSATIGIWTQECSNVIIDSCITNENFNTTLSGFPREIVGILAVGPAKNVIITNSISNNNSLLNPSTTATFLEGILCTDVDNVRIEGCQVSQNRAMQTNGNSSSRLIGIGCENASNIEINNCSVTDNRSEGSATVQAIIEGIRVLSCNNISVQKCVSLANQADGAEANGAAIRLSLVNGAVMKSCHAIGNIFRVQTANNQFGSGIHVQSSQNITVEKCTALNNSSPNNIQTNITGILVDSRAVLIKECIASGQNAPNIFTKVAGIRIDTVSSLSDIVVEGCITENNLNSGQAGQGVGINIRGVQTGTFQHNIAKGNGIGFLIEPLITDTLNCIFLANEASDNVEFGFIDINTVKNNAYMNNIAYNPTGTNFAGTALNTPIRQWIIGSTPSAPVSRDIDNWGLL